jgi:hypothetical protein
MEGGRAREKNRLEELLLSISHQAAEALDRESGSKGRGVGTRATQSEERVRG